MRSPSVLELNNNKEINEGEFYTTYGGRYFWHYTILFCIASFSFVALSYFAPFIAPVSFFLMISMLDSGVSNLDIEFNIRNSCRKNFNFT